MVDEFTPLSPQTRQRVRRLRKDLTGPERVLWNALRGNQLAGLKFRRQHPIGPFIADFCCLEAQLVIELDGDSHIGRAVYDADRQTKIEREGFRVLRLDNDEVLRDLEAVLMGILKACGRDPFTGQVNSSGNSNSSH